jgi:hypothetical protein
MNWLLLIELPLIVVALWVAVRVALLLSARQHNERLLTTLTRLENAAYTSVREIEQVLVEGLKARQIDGRLKDDNAQGARSTAMKALMANLGPAGLREIRRSLGLPRKTPLDRILISHLEAAVYDLKACREPDLEKVTSQPTKRFSPDTVRIARVQPVMPREDDLASLYDDTTPKGGAQ